MSNTINLYVGSEFGGACEVLAIDRSELGGLPMIEDLQGGEEVSYSRLLRQRLSERNSSAIKDQAERCRVEAPIADAVFAGIKALTEYVKGRGVRADTYCNFRLEV